MIKLKKIKVSSGDKNMAMPEVGSYPPTLHLESSQVPEIKDWEVGDTYRMIIEVKQSSKSENKDKSVSASFEVTAYKAMGEMDTEGMSDKDIEDMQGMALSGGR